MPPFQQSWQGDVGRPLTTDTLRLGDQLFLGWLGDANVSALWGPWDIVFGGSLPTEGKKPLAQGKHLPEMGGHFQLIWGPDNASYFPTGLPVTSPGWTRCGCFLQGAEKRTPVFTLSAAASFPRFISHERLQLSACF